MASEKLTHAAFWDRMDRATRHVGKVPAWVKGSPINERPAASPCIPYQSSDERNNSGTNIQEPPPNRR
jgi:hypothetical protein